MHISIELKPSDTSTSDTLTVEIYSNYVKNGSNYVQLIATLGYIPTWQAVAMAKAVNTHSKPNLKVVTNVLPFILKQKVTNE